MFMLCEAWSLRSWWSSQTTSTPSRAAIQWAGGLPFLLINAPRATAWAPPLPGVVRRVALQVLLTTQGTRFWETHLTKEETDLGDT